MRPKKNILLVDASEVELSARKFLLETRGYRVIAVSVPDEALERLAAADPGYYDLVVWEITALDGAELMTAVRAGLPDLTKLLMTSRQVKEYPAWMRADVFLPKVLCYPAALLDNVRVLCARKRGPKKGYGGRPTLLDVKTKMARCA